MSDYCGRCRYDVKAKVGENACPFNSLYWDFLMRNEGRLRDNRRLGVIYGALDRMDGGLKEALRDRAEEVKREFGAVTR